VSLGVTQNRPPSDQWLTRPVDDKTFTSYLDFFAYDRKVPFDTRVVETNNDEGLKRERLSFQSTPGVRVTALFWRPQTEGKAPAVTFLHGGAARGKDAFIPFGAVLARAGWSVLAIDLPYFGERATDLLRSFSQQEKHEKLYNQPSTYLSWVTQVAKDVSRSYDLLVAEKGVDPHRVALIGASRGAIAASIAGAIDHRVRGVVMLYGGHFDDLETNHLPAACPANYIGRIAPRPLLMINGTEDSVMSRDRSVEPLLKIAREPKRIIWAPGGHMFLGEEHRAALIQWLHENTR
jgi:dienelactone hydrolase